MEGRISLNRRWTDRPVKSYAARAGGSCKEELIMSVQNNTMTTTDRPVTRLMIPVLLGALLFSGLAFAAENNLFRLSDRFTMVIDPAAKQQLGDKTYNEVTAFFKAAEQAIETKDLKALMALYSEGYSNGDHGKKSVEQIWKRIFSRFGKMATHHNMQLANMTAMKKSTDKNIIIMRCSGLLLGISDPDKGVVTIDNWTVQDHVLVKEDGKWKLIGTYGRDRKRLWFDKPIHPLF